MRRRPDPDLGAGASTSAPYRRFSGWRIVGLAALTLALTGPGQTVGVSALMDPMIDGLVAVLALVSRVPHPPAVEQPAR